MTSGRAVGDRDFSDVVLGAAGPVLVCFQRGPGEPDGLDLLALDLPWLTLLRLDVDRSPRTPAAYRVADVPSLLVFDRGALVLAVDGRQAPERVLAAVAALAPREPTS